MGAGQSSTSNKPSGKIRILYATLGGTCKTLARKLEKSLQLPDHANVTLLDLAAIDLDDVVLSQKEPCLNIYIIPSYNVETPLDSIFAQLEDAANDFRVGSSMTQVLYNVVGVGHSEWHGEEYQGMARKMDLLLVKLGARRIATPYFVDGADGMS